uniref:Uncharacterized protein n=1 Tax=Rhizophora mucronata TaxID=61149 RepID=A0A2P2IIG5_RHIMU
MSRMKKHVIKVTNYLPGGLFIFCCFDSLCL